MPEKVPAYDGANPYPVIWPEAVVVVTPPVPVAMIADNTIYGTETHAGIPPAPMPPEPGPFDPMSIAGLKGWWKTDVLELNDGDPVDIWPDASGNGNDFSASGSSPTFGGANGVQFNGVDQGMENAQVLSPSNYTIFAVVTPSSNTTPSRVIVEFNGGVYLYHDAADWQVAQFANDASYTYVTDTGGVSVGSPTVLTLNWDGANMNMWKNGTLIGAAAMSEFNSRESISRIGFDQYGDFWDGGIKEILIYNSAIPDADRVSVEGYLQG